MINKKEQITIGPDVLRKRYLLRRTGTSGHSFEVTIPKEVVEREARLLGISVEQVDREAEIEWRYDDFPGLHMVLVPKTQHKF